MQLQIDEHCPGIYIMLQLDHLLEVPDDQKSEPSLHSTPSISTGLINYFINITW